jgi:hypothetical protein
LFIPPGHPELTQINTRYDPKLPFHQQLHAALRDLKAKCEQVSSTELKNPLKLNQPTQKYKTKTFRYYRPQNYAIEARDTDFSEQDIEPTVLKFEEAASDPKESREAIASNASSQVSTTTSKQVRFQDDHFMGYDQRRSRTILENISDDDVSHEGSHVQLNWDGKADKQRNNESKKKSAQKMTNEPSVTSGRAPKAAGESSEQSRGRSRKKIKSSFLCDSKGSISGHRTSKSHGTSVLDVIAQENAGNDTTRKRNISLASSLSHKSKDTKNGENTNSVDRHKRRKAKLDIDTEKISKDAIKLKKRHSASGRGNENEDKDKKSTIERDNDCLKKFPNVTAVVDMRAMKHKSSKNFDVNRHYDNPSKTNAERGANEHKQPKDRHERLRGDLSSKNVEDNYTASRGILKAFEKSRDNQNRKREKMEPSLGKRDEPRKRIIKTKSSCTMPKGDDASNGSKLSKSRRSRKKSRGTQMIQKSGGMDYDFGFTF